jgi:hypothetical protein
MKNDLLVAGEAYRKAWHNKDPEGIAKRLHPEVRLIGPMAETTDKECVLQSAKRMCRLVRALNVRSKFISGDHAIFTYEFVCADPMAYAVRPNS